MVDMCYCSHLILLRSKETKCAPSLVTDICKLDAQEERNADGLLPFNPHIITITAQIHRPPHLEKRKTTNANTNPHSYKLRPPTKKFERK